MKMGKNIALLSITIVTLITLVAIATYSYFTASTNLNNKITTNVKMPLRPTFTVSGGGELALTVTRDFTLQENAYNGTWVSGKNFQQVRKDLTINLTGEPGTICNYNVYYKDVSSNGNYVYSHTGSLKDLAIYFYSYEGSYGNTTSLLNDVDYLYFSSKNIGEQKVTALFGESSSPFNNAKPTITIPSGSTSAINTHTFFIRFMNQNYDQSVLAGKTFKGELYVGDVSCT